MKTVFNLRSGQLQLTFSPGINSRQYTELLELVKGAATSQNALELIRAWARKNEVTVE